VIVALSSLITKDIEKRTMEAGFDLALQSPLHAKTIHSKIEPLLQQRKDNMEFQSEAHVFKQQAMSKILKSKGSQRDLAELLV
jgi:hypothetical protein